MKKTFTINISGRVFHIDEDAHEKLHNYLTKITRYFGNDADAKEIEQDIEARISELFSERLKAGNEVITIELVEEVIQIMGMPEDFSETREEKAEEKSPLIMQSRRRKLYRDPDNRVLGGVCSGLGAYFNIDPVIIRLIFILLVFLAAGSGILIYIILWIVVPKARSIAQRLEMKGEQVNVNSISKSVKEEIQEVKTSYDKFRKSKTYSQGGDVLLSILRAAFKVITVVIGAFLILVGILLFISVISTAFIPEGFMPLNYLHLFASPHVMLWFWIGVVLTLAIPLIFLIYIGLKLIFRFRPINAPIGLSMFGLWLIGLIILIASAVSGVTEYKISGQNIKQEIIPTKSDTLYVKIGKDEFTDYIYTKFKIGRLTVASLNDNKDVIVGRPLFTIEAGEPGNYSLMIKAKARGNDLQKAQANAKEVLYKYEQNDSLLTFNPWFVIPGRSHWYDQDIEISLRVPMNKTVYLSKGTETIIKDIKSTSNTSDEDMVGKYWTMKPEGLELATRKPASLQNSQKSRK